MFILVRATAYAAIFVGLVVVFLPVRLLSWSGIAPPSHLGLPQIAGMIIAASGAVVAAWCVLAFALVGRGTPAPFDPPRRLVIAGPYRFVRNPMYIGAGLTLAGAAMFYQSLLLLGFSALFIVAAHLFVVFHEEPALERHFGEEYTAYRRRVRRWWPRP